MRTGNGTAMVFVLRTEHHVGQQVTREDAVDAAVRGMLMILADRRPEVIAAVEHWVDGPFAKIVKRARGKGWEQIETIDSLLNAHVRVGTAEMIVFSPMALEEQPPAVRSAQVSGLKLESGCRPPVPGGLVMHVNDALGMTTGKIIAQVCHAVQVFVSAHPRRTRLWLDAGGHINLVNGITSGEHSVVITDAGHTEIDPGSVTVVVD
ncbi:aminoacyl-tRNA hydrolase [Pseudoclavibacter sp. CFCC 13796]|uniref:aminoacyl-tRNA hydrolase n=1 Tax=Pseudoclavibacter sp. CFCC 13796 TaxID=2615179 RepID=UPI0017883841|nr:aminoacyl-tRNA hydrolase [Pseudoclavibacter sp. CFCC 13796]